MLTVNSNHYPKIILHGGRLLDFFNQQELTGVVLQIERGQISALYLNTDPQIIIDKTPDSLIVCRPDLTILPGLVDCHVHLALDGDDFNASLNRWENQWLTHVQGALDSWLERGVIAIRDGGDRAGIGLQAKNLLNKGILKGPRIIASGQALGKKGRYGSFLGPGITNLQEAKEFITSMQQQGADYIKILVSGIVSFAEFGKVGDLHFTQRELAYLVEFCHHLGLPVMAHASSDEAVAQAVQAGVDTMEHGYFLSPSSLKAMAQHNVPWIPTVVPVANQIMPPYVDGYSRDAQEIIHRTYQLHLENINQAHQLGVTLGIGTDAGASGVPHGKGYLRELELYLEAGLDAKTVLSTATLNSAAICGLKGLGSFKTGSPAKFIGVKGDPWLDLTPLDNPELVIY